MGKIFLLIGCIVVAGAVVGCGPKPDETGTLPVSKPVAPEAQQEAQKRLANDPKADENAPRQDGS